jgi:hypothetical protein
VSPRYLASATLPLVFPAAARSFDFAFVCFIHTPLPPQLSAFARNGSAPANRSA